MNIRLWWAIAGLVVVVGAFFVLSGSGVAGALFGGSARAEAEAELLAAVGGRLNDLAFVSGGSVEPSSEEARRLYGDYLASLTLAAQEELDIYRRLTGRVEETQSLDRLLARYQEHLDAVDLREDGEARAAALRRLVGAAAPTFRDVAAALMTGRPDFEDVQARIESGAAQAFLARPSRPLQVTTDKREYRTDEPVRFRLTNIGEEDIGLPDTAPVILYREVETGVWRRVQRLEGLATVAPLQPGRSLDVTWTGASDGGGKTPGQYEARVDTLGWSDRAFTVRFTVR